MKPTSRRESPVARLVLAAALVAAPAAARDTRGWVRAGNVGRDVLVVAALGLPVAQGDWHGVEQAGGSMGAALAGSSALKALIHERRPDRSNNRSFPSGHAATAFAAAATLQNRYGWGVGVPAQLVAGFVGLARVEGRKHHWYDVVAGAALGEASGFLLTRKGNDHVRVMPWGESTGGGLALSAAF